MMTTTMARGETRKSINDSISEHKRIVTSNIIYSITIYHTNKLELFTDSVFLVGIWLVFLGIY
jgi:hypothetical protein